MRCLEDIDRTASENVDILEEIDIGQAILGLFLSN